MTNPRAFKANPDKVINALKRELNSRVHWDEEPELGFIYAEGENRIRTSTLSIPDSMWQQANDPKNLLRGFIELITEPPNELAALTVKNMLDLIPPEFVGIFLRVEGWGPPPEAAEEIRRRKLAGGSIGRFAQMEGRQEFRTAMAVDTENMVYLAEQPRDTMVLEGFYASGGPSDSLTEGKDTLGGAIPELLSELLSLLLPKEAEGDQ